MLLGKGRGVGVVGFRPLSPPRPPHAPCSAPERKVSVLSELRSVHAREGDGATFECTLSEVETTGNWELGGRPLRPGGRIRIRQEGLADFLPTLAPRCAAPSSDRPRPQNKSHLQLEWARPTTQGAVSRSFPRPLLWALVPDRLFPIGIPIPPSPALIYRVRTDPGTYSGPTLIPELPPEAALASLAPSSPPGKKHFLVLSELCAEDAGEVRFQAGPAQSVAQLEVEGKQLGRGRPGVGTISTWDWQAGG